MPVLRFPHIPPRFASGGWLTLPSGAVQPVNAQVAPTMPLAPVWGRSLPLTVASLSASLAIRRDRTIVLQRRERRFLPCLKARVSAPQIR
jgi:hypothetical protein